MGSDDHSDPIVDNLEHASVGATGVDGVLFIAFSVLAGLFVQVIWEEVKFLKKYVPLPYTVVIFIIGLAWGYCSPKYENGYSLDTAMTTLVGIDPHLFLQLFIPPLLFESGWAMNIHMFKKCTWPCLWLASVGGHFNDGNPVALLLCVPRQLGLEHLIDLRCYGGRHRSRSSRSCTQRVGRS